MTLKSRRTNFTITCSPADALASEVNDTLGRLP